MTSVAAASRQPLTSPSASASADPGSRDSGQAEPPGVAVVAASAAERLRLRTLVRAAGLEVVDQAARLSAVASDLPSGSVIMLDGRAASRDDIADTTTRTPVLVVMSGEAWSPRAVSDQGRWSSISASASARALRAAITAAAEGLIVCSHLAAAPNDCTCSEIEPLAEELTPREREVLTLLAEGLLNRTIAARLRISPHTVKFHVAAIYGKLGASTRARAIRIALQRGLLHL